MKKYTNQNEEYYAYKIPHDLLDHNFIAWLFQLKIEYTHHSNTEIRVHNGLSDTWVGFPDDWVVYRIRDKVVYMVNDRYFNKQYFNKQYIEVPVKETIDTTYYDCDKLEELAIEFMESEGISINENYRYAFTLSYPDVTMLMARFAMYLKEKENEIS